VLDQAGPGCPRCGESVGPSAAGAGGVGIDIVLGAALSGSFIGLLVAALIILTQS
jgi:hypothetical protein